MESPVQGRTSWPGMEPPCTVERRRKGRGLDVIGAVPTPPHARQNTQLPTPETIRQPRKQAHDKSLAPASTSITGLPTPQTLPRPARTASQPAEQVASPPSPTGHTTFFLASSSASQRYDGPVRRRPGLTFAQQMGLLSNPAGPSGFGGRLGAGVGIGGTMRSGGGHGKVDQICGRLEAPASLPLEESGDNPFLVREDPARGSPGRMTMHKPRLGIDEDEDVDMISSPLGARRSPHLASPPSLTKLSDPSPAETTLLSPPPTHRATKILVADPQVAARARAQREAQREAERRLREERRRMLDIDDNPFLAKPGEASRPRESPVDESHPTVTYVFRGSKKVFANPFMHPAQPFPPADLDPSDMDFEPHPNPKPRLLWPTGPDPKVTLEAERTPSPDERSTRSPTSSPPMFTPQSRRRRFSEVDPSSMELDLEATKHAFSSQSSLGEGIDEEEDDEEDMPVRRGLLFGAGNGTKRALDADEDTDAKRPKGLRV